MKISWPHMGSLEVILGGVFEELQLDYILPPPNSERTLELGARYGPEFACFPLKTTLGNFIEAIEVAKTCDAALPGIVLVYGIEVGDPFSLGQEVSEGLKKRVGSIVEQIISDVRDALKSKCTNSESPPR